MVLRKTGSLANGPTQAVVALTILLVLASSFFTAIIGIHPIFGAFMVGLICPHEGGFAIKLTEKIEDLVSVLFLPLYFALSGLKTNLGLLNNGITWAYVIGVCAVAFLGKIAGGTLASRLNGLVWRESLTIGCLMSCKGLVELIVLNIGLQAKILSPTTFTIFVVMALVTTFATTPLVSWLYPPWYQRKLELWKAGKIDWEGNLLDTEHDVDDSNDTGSLQKHEVARKILVYLRVDALPSLFTLVSLLASKRTEEAQASPQKAEMKGEDGTLKFMKQPTAMASLATLHRPVRVHGLRLMELTERESSVMRVSEIEEYASRDPIIKAFGTFGQSKDISIGGQIAVVPERSFSGTLMRRARDLGSDFILLPWSETGTMSEYPSLFDEKTGDPLHNREFAKLVSETFDKARDFCHVGVFIDKAVMIKTAFPESPSMERPTRRLTRTATGISVTDKRPSMIDFKLADSGRERLIVLYQGGDDDLFAVRFGMQLARNEIVDLNVIRAGVSSDDDSEDSEFDTIKASIPAEMQSRVTFTDDETAALEAALNAVHEPSSAETMVIVGRGSVDMSSSMQTTSSHNDHRALGPLSTTALHALRENGVNAGLMVVQAKRDIGEDGLKRKATNHSEDM